MIKIYKYLCLGLFVWCFSCQSIDKKPTPARLLTEDEMVTMLIELTILKATSTVASNIQRNSGIDFNDYIAKKIGVDSLTIAENLAYYSYIPKNIRIIYERVEDSLEVRYQLHDSLYKKYNKSNLDDYKNLENHEASEN